MKRYQGKFVKDGIYFDKFKEFCGYIGFGEIVLLVIFVICEILVFFKRKS